RPCLHCEPHGGGIDIRPDDDERRPLVRRTRGQGFQLRAPSLPQMQYESVRQARDAVQRIDVPVDDELALDLYSGMLAQQGFQRVERVLAAGDQQDFDADIGDLTHGIAVAQHGWMAAARGTPRLSRGSVVSKPEITSVGMRKGMMSGRL